MHHRQELGVVTGLTNNDTYSFTVTALERCRNERPLSSPRRDPNRTTSVCSVVGVGVDW